MNRGPLLMVPGRFSLTNTMLDNLRAAGQYEGRAAVRRCRPRADHDLFARETLAIRLAVKAAARRACLLPLRGNARARVAWLIVGHERHDPDAGALWGKAAVDGLVDARALASDRHDLAFAGGRVCTSHEESAAAIARAERELFPGWFSFACRLPPLGPEWAGAFLRILPTEEETCVL